MSIRLYNTKSRSKEELQPIRPGKISFYLCGPTVYDYFHVGNARCWVIFDVIRRYLEYRGYDVTYIVNLTDVDDKIIQKANATGSTPEAVSSEFIEAFFQDSDALGIHRATANPKATEFIPGMIALIQALVARGYAYAVNGDVFFHVASYDQYGELSGKRLEDLIAGSRVDVDDRKQSPADFALWKAAKPGEPSWDSPWGPGRPGWHIECSVMSMHYLGKEFDIHAGAEDLVFPHHENEIAQSRCGADAPYARYWMHLKFLNFDKQKMSKSLGNVFTVREVLKHISAEALRYFLLQEHYRKPMEMAAETFWQVLKGAQSAVERLGRTYANLALVLERSDGTAAPAQLTGYPAEKEAAIRQAMEDDFNAVAALGHVFELARWVNEHIGDTEPPVEEFASALQIFDAVNRYMGVIPAVSAGADDTVLENLRGFVDHILEQWKGDDILETHRSRLTSDRQSISALMETLLVLRAAFRTGRRWDRSDYLRDALAEQGFVLEDTAGTTRWRKQ